MKSFDVQSVSIDQPADAVFDFVAEPTNLPKWTNAFSRADDHSADLVTPNGVAPIKLKTIANRDNGTIDWHMTFPDGAQGVAYSRVTPNGQASAVYSFVLMAPPVPLEALEGALNEQIQILAKELLSLKGQLEA